MTTADYIRDAAEPIARALGVVQTLGIHVPPVDLQISYTNGGCIIRVAERSSAHRDAIETAFSTAFTTAGWGVAVRHAGGLTMQHPISLTRL
jgi:hypothetical protein